MAGRFAIDIETVSPPLDHYEKPPDFQDPQYFELLAVVLGYESPDGEKETEMLFRTSDAPEDELDLIARTLDWLEERAGDTYLTYGGEFFDVPQLIGRGEARPLENPDEQQTVDRLQRLLTNEWKHNDLQKPAWDAFGDYTRFEEACANGDIEPEETHWAEFEHGVNLDEIRPSKFQGFEKVINKDITVFGERYLELADVGATETLTFRSLRNLLEHYGQEDTIHLFSLADERPFDG